MKMETCLKDLPLHRFKTCLVSQNCSAGLVSASASKRATYFRDRSRSSRLNSRRLPCASLVRSDALSPIITSSRRKSRAERTKEEKEVERKTMRKIKNPTWNQRELVLTSPPTSSQIIRLLHGNAFLMHFPHTLMLPEKSKFFSQETLRGKLSATRSSLVKKSTYCAPKLPVSLTPLCLYLKACTGYQKRTFVRLKRLLVKKISKFRFPLPGKPQALPPGSTITLVSSLTVRLLMLSL